jgi:hypothetical protein
MKKRSPVFVFLVGFVTIFVYSWYWLVKTKGEMNALGQKVPTAFIWLIPVVGTIWWMWKYSEAVENVTNKEISKVLAFVVIYLLGPIGNAIVQDYFNKLEPSTVTASAANAPSQSPSPTVPPQTASTLTPSPSVQPPAGPVGQKPPNPPVVGG